MPKSRKIILVAVGAFICLIIIVVGSLFLFADLNAFKPRIEAAAAGTLGMDVRIGGRLGIGFSPGLFIMLADVHIRNGKVDVVSAKKARLWVDLPSLFQGEVRIKKIALIQPRISIEQERDGTFNFEQREAAGRTLPPLTLTSFSLSNGTILYTDMRSGAVFTAGRCNLDIHHLRFMGGKGANLMTRLSFTAILACEEIRKNNFTVSNLKFAADGQNGIFNFNPISMNVFGGQGSGSIRADFSRNVPCYHVRYSVPKFHIEEFFKTFTKRKVADGVMDFSTILSMQGMTFNEMKQTANGQISLQGENLTLHGADLDREFARYKSSQNFNLVDVGAVFLAGPVGLVVTKGYNFASFLHGSGGHSEIRQLVSDWKVNHGVAQAQDVAMTTNKNRIALKGDIDFVSEKFNDVTVALVNDKGCAKILQTIHGTLKKPVIDRPNILDSITGPAFNFIKKARDLFPGGRCKVFYTGSIAPPK
ncbi:MAG: AsmA family protein [Acidiferrobacterales bacterium]